MILQLKRHKKTFIVEADKIDELKHKLCEMINSSGGLNEEKEEGEGDAHSKIPQMSKFYDDSSDEEYDDIEDKIGSVDNTASRDNEVIKEEDIELNSFINGKFESLEDLKKLKDFSIVGFRVREEAFEIADFEE